MVEPVVSLADPQFLNNPVHGYARLREQAPLVRIGMHGVPPVWLATRFDDVQAILTDRRFVVDIGNVPGHRGRSVVQQILAAYGMPEEYWEYVANMTFADGAELARLRRLVTPVFSARRTSAMRPRVRQLTDELVDALVTAGGGDLLGDFSSPLTSTVICELIGIDEAGQPQLRRWMHDYTAGDRLTSAVEMVDYVKDLIRRRRAEPADDMVSMLLSGGDGTGDRLSESEIVAMVLLMVNNGHLSTAHFIPNSVVVLHDHPDQLALLRERPELMPRAIHELMRITSPAALATPRYATEDVEIGGMPVRKGEAVTVSLQSANYDPRRFPDPERVDITRDPGRAENHIAFGAGPHYCLGAALGRLEGEVALDRLLLQETGLTLAVDRDELEYVDVALAVRLLERLPVRL
jgi:cytochrome P450